MPSPYQPPRRDEDEPRHEAGAGLRAPLVGCGVGGCLLPGLLLLTCALLLGDTGGPLFWPFIAIPMGLIGLAAGFVVRAARSRR